MNWLIPSPHPLPSAKPQRVRKSRAKTRIFPTETCGICGKSFAKKLPWMKYCGTTCRDKAHYEIKIRRMRAASALKPKRFDLTCIICGTPYMSKRSWSKYCGEKCRNKRGERCRA